MNSKKEQFRAFLTKKDTRNIIFIALMAAIPLAQFAVFYVYLNLKTVFMAFQQYDEAIGSYVWFGLENFKLAFEEYYTQGLLWVELKNTFFYFIATTGVGTLFAVLFSYYIYKKRVAASVFKIILFLPSIISSITIVLMYKYFMDYPLPWLLSPLTGDKMSFVTKESTAFATVLFYCVWAGFGSGILLYSGAMGGISESMVEAAKLDGASLMQEFYHITLPNIYPTLSTFIVANLASLFVADMALFSFFGHNAPPYLRTIGYDILRRTYIASLKEYPYVASLGMILTIFTLPLTYGAKYLLTKLGPSTE